MSPVTLQVDLKNLFQLDNLALNFKVLLCVLILFFKYSCLFAPCLNFALWIWPPQGPRPSDFVIERSLDNGTTWKPALYLATDCQKAFPGIPTTAPLRLDEPHCYTLPPAGSDSYQDQIVCIFTDQLLLLLLLLVISDNDFLLLISPFFPTPNFRYDINWSTNTDIRSCGITTLWLICIVMSR